MEHFEHSGDLIDVAGCRICGDHIRILAVGIIAWHSGSAFSSPHLIGRLTFTEVCKCHDVTGIIGLSGLVSHPNLDTIDLYASGEIWQMLHCIVIDIAEILGEEEVTVFLIVGSIYLKRIQLHSALTADALGV